MFVLLFPQTSAFPTIPHIATPASPKVFPPPNYQTINQFFVFIDWNHCNFRLDNHINIWVTYIHTQNILLFYRYTHYTIYVLKGREREREREKERECPLSMLWVVEGMCKLEGSRLYFYILIILCARQNEVWLCMIPDCFGLYFWALDRLNTWHRAHYPQIPFPRKNCFLEKRV